MIMEMLLGSQVIQSAISVALVTVATLLIKRFRHGKHVANLSILAYKYANEQGLLQGIKGYDKLSLFMENFVKRYEAEYRGLTPTPEDKAAAVKVAEKEVVKEDHLGLGNS